MHEYSTFIPSYIPKLHDLVYIQIPDLSNNDIPYRVVSMAGSPKQQKVTILCSQGSGSTHSNIHLIWKKGMRSWMAWFMNRKYEYVIVRKA